MHKRSFKSIITGSAPAQSMALIVAIIVILGTATRLPSVNPAASNDKYIAIVPLGTAIAYFRPTKCAIFSSSSLVSACSVIQAPLDI